MSKPRLRAYRRPRLTETRKDKRTHRAHLKCWAVWMFWYGRGLKRLWREGYVYGDYSLSCNIRQMRSLEKGWRA